MTEGSVYIDFDKVEWYYGEGNWQEKVVVSPELGAGKLSVAYVIFGSGGSTHDYHVHEDLDEAVIVVDGVLDAFKQSSEGEIRVPLKRGDVFFTPRGTPHRFANPYLEPATAIAAKAIL
ncbi:MAG: cupin domain-containing protein [Chloroflexi bacterium]|nr:cupin domain-containing protein [Chloroflexota bacterium]MCL5075183.1 cupin domain-containing protein [Chloroflexota bacterium]